MSEETKNRPDLIAYAVRESNGKSFFTRIGVEFSNSKGGHNVHLDANPLDGKIVLLRPKSEEQEG